MPHGFFVEFASKKPLDCYSIDPRGDRTIRKSTMFDDTIYIFFSSLMGLGDLVTFEFCSNYHLIGISKGF